MGRVINPALEVISLLLTVEAVHMGFVVDKVS
jgi:hypothetical protein